MLAIGALLISGPRIGAPDHHHGVMLGAAAGVLFGVSDVAIKALTGARRRGSAMLLSPWLAVTIIASVVAFYASARGLQDGEAVPVIAATSTAANVSCILGGIIVFGDPMPGDTLGIVVQALRLRARRRRRARHSAAGARGRGERRTPSAEASSRTRATCSGSSHVGTCPQPASVTCRAAGQRRARARRLAGEDQQAVAVAPGDRRRDDRRAGLELAPRLDARAGWPGSCASGRGCATRRPSHPAARAPGVRRAAMRWRSASPGCAPAAGRRRQRPSECPRSRRSTSA